MCEIQVIYQKKKKKKKKKRLLYIYFFLNIQVINYIYILYIYF